MANKKKSTGGDDTHSVELTSVFDHDTLLVLFRRFAGRTFVGAVDGGDCVELVFDSYDDTTNMVTVFTDSTLGGVVALGHVGRGYVEHQAKAGGSS